MRDIGAGAAAMLAAPWWAPAASAALQPVATKRIMASGELIPTVGIGTARRYAGARDEQQLAPLREALRIFVREGGKVVDTAPSYGDAESVLGLLIEQTGLRDSLFLATKVSASGRQDGVAQIEQSFKNLRTDRLDLVAVHNLRDVATQLQVLREFKGKGLVRYIGLTTSSTSQHEEMVRLIRGESIDFVQVDYAIDHREAEKNVLRAAVEQNVAVMVNLPFGRGRVFEAVRDRPLPDWAAELDIRSWAQFFLKYLISHKAVTCVIPGTSTAAHALDNTGAMRGRLPDPFQRERMAALIARL
ncbi:MAG: aldo/keto reductase [Burkholderiaceae bacterium]